MPNIRLLPRPRLVQRGHGIRGTMKKIGHFARPVLNNLARTILPMGTKQLRRIGSNYIKKGADLLTQAIEKKNNIKTGGRLFFPLIQQKQSNASTSLKSALDEPAKKRRKKIKK